MLTLLSVAAGGAIGAILRYGAGLVVVRLWGSGFPWATLCVNVLGSFLIGLAAGALAARFGPFVTIGILGSFTTFSTFSLDALRLLEAGRLGAGLLYIGGTLGLCLCMVALGAWLVRGAAL